LGGGHGGQQAKFGELLQVYVACVWDVSEECLQVFHANVAKVDLDVAML
jgi:hypothetical protein